MAPRVLGNTGGADSTEQPTSKLQRARMQPPTTRENNGTLRSERTNVTFYHAGSKKTSVNTLSSPPQNVQTLARTMKRPQPANLGMSMYSSEEQRTPDWGSLLRSEFKQPSPVHPTPPRIYFRRPPSPKNWFRNIYSSYSLGSSYRRGANDQLRSYAYRYLRFHGCVTTPTKA